MIPGNRPEDVELDAALEDATERLAEANLDPREIRLAVEVGIAAALAARVLVSTRVGEALAVLAEDRRVTEQEQEHEQEK